MAEGGAFVYRAGSYDPQARRLADVDIGQRRRGTFDLHLVARPVHAKKSNPGPPDHSSGLCSRHTRSNGSRQAFGAIS